VPASLVPPPPDAPQRKGALLDFIGGLRKRSAAQAPQPAEPAEPPAPSAVESISVSDEGLPPPPEVLRRPRAKQRRGWLRSTRRWGSVLFRVAVACAVSGLAVAYEQRVRLSSTGSPGAASHEARVAAPALQLTGHRGPVVAVASAVEDQWIVSAGADATLRVWSAESGGEVRTIDLAEGPATAFAVDGRRALVGHRDGSVVLWDLDTAAKLATFRHGSATITAVAFLGDRVLVASRDGGVGQLDLRTPGTPEVPLDAQESGGHLIATAPGRSLLVSAGLDRTVRLWRGLQPQLVRTYRLPGDSAAVAIAPDAGFVAMGSADGVVRFQRSPGLRGPGAHTVQTLKAHAGGVTAIALGPSGLLASAGEDGSLKLWTLHPRRMVRALDGGQVQSLTFSRDGRRLLAGGKDGVIRVWITTPLVSRAT
jgi:WD40 repeat protein